MIRLWILLFSFQTFGASDLLLEEKGADINFEKKVQRVVTFKLDNPFLAQVYTKWKTERPTHQINEFMNLMFEGKYKDAYLKLSALNSSSINLKKAIEAYLLFELGHSQSFINSWIDISTQPGFLNSDLGIALDKTIGPNIANIYETSGLFLTHDQKVSLLSIEASSSEVNFFLQALKNIRSGKDAVQWIGKIAERSSLRVKLAKTAILDYAKDNKLGASGKLVKQILEPWIEKSENTEEIAQYYMTLARLLYQAGAMEQAEHFYGLIPQTSKYFLESRVESVWVHLRTKNFSKVKGELKSLGLDTFHENFYPEVYLTGAIANTLLCQFTDARNAINNFVTVNSKWNKLINEKLSAKKIDLVRANDETRNLEKVQTSLKIEIANYSSMGLKQKAKEVNQKLQLVSQRLSNIAKKQWNNRRVVLESAIYRMKFTRIELLSRMRNMDIGNKILGKSEKPEVYASSEAQANQIKFPNDGLLWGDELFHIEGDGNSFCL